MASFARSFKPPPPAYLSPCRRPAMPGRTLSSSSELSLTSTASAGLPGDDSADQQMPSSFALAASILDEERASSVNKDILPSGKASPRSGCSRPIAIELPKIKKLSSASVYTPPEPLSARGDLPGGYFPMHEDPGGRVYRPHPFHHEASSSRRHLQPDIMHPERKETKHAASTRTASMAQANMPAASYLAPGFHDSPLPLGKYYPSNYEQNQNTKVRRHVRPATNSCSRPEPQISKHGLTHTTGESPEAEMRRRMQQYQRDMIAQAAMALGSSAKMLTGLPLKEAWRAGSSPHKPISPRLHPLGSPGPVTPMDLESVGGGYVDHGRRAPDFSVETTTISSSSPKSHSL